LLNIQNAAIATPSQEEFKTAGKFKAIYPNGIYKTTMITSDSTDEKVFELTYYQENHCHFQIFDF
jgi:hypothetical protein